VGHRSALEGSDKGSLESQSWWLDAGARQRYEIIDLMAGLDLNIHGDGDGLKIVVALFVDSLDGPVVGKAIP
jgi:hypothetical protein